MKLSRPGTVLPSPVPPNAVPPVPGPPGPGVQVPAPAVDHVQGHHVGRGGPVRHRVRAAGVVADHPADGAPRVRGRIGPEPQPVTSGRPLQLVQDHPRLHGGDARGRVDADHLIEVPAHVEHDAGADRVARYRRAPAPDGHRHGQVTADVHHGENVIGGPREHDGLGDDPVVGGIGGVLGPAPRRGVHHVPAEGGPQPPDEFSGVSRHARGHIPKFVRRHLGYPGGMFSVTLVAIIDGTPPGVAER